jgi:hypothetical protein
MPNERAKVADSLDEACVTVPETNAHRCCHGPISRGRSRKFGLVVAFFDNSERKEVLLNSLRAFSASVGCNLVRKSELRATFPLRPHIVGSNVSPDSVRVDASEVGLKEVKRPLNSMVASLAERSQIPRQEIPFVAVQVVNREEVRSWPVSDSAKLATPTSPPSNPS